MDHHFFSQLKSVDALYALFAELSVHSNMDGVIVFGRWIGKFYYIRFMESGTKRGFLKHYVLPGVLKFFNITSDDVLLEDTTPHVATIDNGGHSNGVFPRVGDERSKNKWNYFMKTYKKELQEEFPTTLEERELFLCSMRTPNRNFEHTLVPREMQLSCGRELLSSSAVPSFGGLTLALERLKVLNVLPLSTFHFHCKGSTLPRKAISNAKQAFINFLSNVFVFDDEILIS